MSLAKSLRTFLQSISPIAQVAQQNIPANYKVADGFIWFARRATQPARTMQRGEVSTPDQQFFDVEIYHKSIDAVEEAADALQAFDTHRGEFGSGKIQALFVESQSDDYVPRVDMTDTENLSSAFLSLEIRSYKEP